MGVFISQEDLDRALAHDAMVIEEHKAHKRMFARHMRRLNKLENGLISSQYPQGKKPLARRFP